MDWGYTIVASAVVALLFWAREDSGLLPAEAGQLGGPQVAPTPHLRRTRREPRGHRDAGQGHAAARGSGAPRLHGRPAHLPRLADRREVEHLAPAAVKHLREARAVDSLMHRARGLRRQDRDGEPVDR